MLGYFWAPSRDLQEIHMALRGPRISRCVGILGIPAVGTTYPDCVSCSSMVQAAVTAPRCEQGDRQRCRHSGLLWKAQGSNWGGFETRSSVALRVHDIEVIQCGTVELVRIMHYGYPHRCILREPWQGIQIAGPGSNNSHVNYTNSSNL